VQKKINHLALFAKFWEPGKVKTRLAATTGPKAAAGVYRVFLQTLLRRFDQQADERTIVYAPRDQTKPFEAISQNHWTLHPQLDGDLGNRLTDFSRSVFDRHDGQVKTVIIGSDCLDLDQDLVEQAFEALNEADVVLGPCLDGGYYLVGMSKFCPEIFEAIDWSTEAVYPQTLQRVSDNNYSLIILPTLNDVDDMNDLTLLERQLEEQGRADQNSTQLLAAIRSAMATE
jgi:rSAM/selenodomain-associated transferase 1